MTASPNGSCTVSYWCTWYVQLWVGHLTIIRHHAHRDHVPVYRSQPHAVILSVGSFFFVSRNTNKPLHFKLVIHDYTQLIRLICGWTLDLWIEFRILIWSDIYLSAGPDYHASDYNERG